MSDAASLPGTVAIVGLGYVGLPLAVAFGRHRKTIGFDLNTKKIACYSQGVDPTGEVDRDSLLTATQLEFTDNPKALAQAEFILVVVPTPINEAHLPDLAPLKKACRTVGENMASGAVVVFESTVYPGCTEEVCVPILEKYSRLSWLGREGPLAEAHGFYVGYSPERINPGDKVHTLQSIIKVVSGDTPDTLTRIASLYESVVEAGVYQASSVKVAEAAKIIENTQRDLNIALMNELALIFNLLDIDTQDVLEAAGTKWNFLPFRPGLVGGHCIGVDPYYLTYKAQSVGHHPKVVLAGRKTNDGMGKFIVEQTVKQLAKLGHPINGARVTVLGLTFKEDCSDLRNSRVEDILTELKEYCCEVSVHDPMASAPDALHEYGVALTDWQQLEPAHALILAVPHKHYLDIGTRGILSKLLPDGVVIDVKSILDREVVKSIGASIWRL